MFYMNQLDKLLNIFDNEIKQLIFREDSPREFYLLKNDVVGKLKDLFQEVGNETFSIVYDRKIIEVYYNPINITNNFIQAPKITDEILQKIFKYLGHHEYGHSLFCESTQNYGKFREKHKDSQPTGEIPREVKERRTEPLNIGKTTDALKTMGMGEMINIIRQASFQDLYELTENITETITHIETWEDCEEFDGIFSFINLLLKSPFTDEEFLKIFEIILKKFLEISDFRIEKLRDKIRESIQKGPVKKWIRENQLIDDLIKVFLESKSFKQAEINSRMVYPFAEELSENQVIKILEKVVINDQIYDSYKTKPIIAAIIRIHREKIPINLWCNLIDKKLDERGISIAREFKESGIAIIYSALYFILGLEDSWKKVELIIKQVSSIPNFKKSINFSVLKKISDEEIQEKLSTVSFNDLDEEIISKIRLKIVP